ncbi:MAG: DNA polymerase III subunit delta [Candidatus Cloacimonadota bacterium]|nr:MAG: DNA polymerase III subunit delta [Candidatus Cloacimonadota bacterium]
MQKLKYDDLLQQLHKNKLYPVYFFTEEEAFLKDKAIELLYNKLISKGASTFDYNLIYGEETDAKTILETIQTPPIIAKKRLVIVKHFDKMNISYREQILAYTEHPIDFVVLVLETDKVNTNTGYYRKLAQKCATFYFYHPYNIQNAVDFINTEAKKNNKQISRDTIMLLVNNIGLNYLELNNEFQKLLIYVKDRNIIKLEDVEHCIGVLKENNIFELQNSIGKRNLHNSFIILENMLENGASGVYLITMLLRFFKELWLIKILRENHITEQEIWTTHLPHVFYFYRKERIQLARNFTIKEIAQIFALLLNTDIEIKSTSTSERILMEMLIYKICQIGNA